jgi:hypothetical protein
MDWTVFNTDYVVGALPLVRKPYAQSYLTDPGTAAVFAEKVDAIRADFRNALAMAGNTVDEDATKLPLVCLRHAAHMAEYELALLLDGESGYVWNPNLSALIRAEVYLRAIVETRMQLDAGTGGAPVPTYGPPEVSEPRSLP